MLDARWSNFLCSSSSRSEEFCKSEWLLAGVQFQYEAHIAYRHISPLDQYLFKNQYWKIIAVLPGYVKKNYAKNENEIKTKMIENKKR